MGRAPLEVVVGARPNFVKAAALWRALVARGAESLSLVHTGQHRADELAVAFGRALGLPDPHATLAIGSPRTDGGRTAAILATYEQHLLALPALPRAVIVIGDVDSTLACALAAAKLRVPIVHVEAGLRSFDRAMPEELNRVLVDAMSSLLLASEPSALLHLAREGIDPDRVARVGSLSVDTLAHELAAARALRVPERLGLGDPFAYVTLHRPSNVDDRAQLHAVIDALEEIAARVPVVFPVHPRTAARLDDAGLRDRVERALRVSPPLAYRDAIGLMSAAAVVITDSGGVQEETTYLGVPCLTLRQSTERPVTVDRGTNTLIGRDPRALAEHVGAALGAPRTTPEVEGWDGHAAERAADAILARYG